MMHKLDGRSSLLKQFVTPELFPSYDVGQFCRTSMAKCGVEVLVKVELDGRMYRPKLHGHEIGPRWDKCDCPECLKCRTAT